MCVSNGVCAQIELTEVAAHYGPFRYEPAASWTSLNKLQRKQGTEGTEGIAPREGREDGDSRISKRMPRPSVFTYFTWVGPSDEKVVPLTLEFIERVSLVSTRNRDMIIVITVPCLPTIQGCSKRKWIPLSTNLKELNAVERHTQLRGPSVACSPSNSVVLNRRCGDWGSPNSTVRWKHSSRAHDTRHGESQRVMSHNFFRIR